MTSTSQLTWSAPGRSAHGDVTNLRAQPGRRWPPQPVCGPRLRGVGGHWNLPAGGHHLVAGVMTERERSLDRLGVAPSRRCHLQVVDSIPGAIHHLCSKLHTRRARRAHQPRHESAFLSGPLRRSTSGWNPRACEPLPFARVPHGDAFALLAEHAEERHWPVIGGADQRWLTCLSGDWACSAFPR
jgi:hypothetical protein